MEQRSDQEGNPRRCGASSSTTSTGCSTPCSNRRADPALVASERDASKEAVEPTVSPGSWPQEESLDAQPATEEVPFESAPSDGAAATRLGGDNAFCRSPLKPTAKGFRSSRCSTKKGASWLLLEKEIDALACAEREEEPASPSWSLLAKARAFVAQHDGTPLSWVKAVPDVAAEPVAVEEAHPSIAGGTPWFNLERQVVYCAFGLNYYKSPKSTRGEAVDIVNCWPSIKNLFQSSVA